MKMTVGTEATLVDTGVAYSDLGAAGQVVVIQNLGPGDVYVDFDPAVSTSTGIKIGAQGGYEFARASKQGLYVVSTEANTDVRVMAVG